MNHHRSNPVFLTLVALLAVGLCSCAPEPEPQAPTPESIASAEREGAKLEAHADRVQIQTTDRLTLTTTATAPVGMVIRSVEIEPETEGWTTVSSTGPETSLDDSGRAVQTLVHVLEPFLAGDYVVPPVTASFAAPGAPGSIALSTTPIAITVGSVLAEDAAIDALSPTNGPVNPPELAEHLTNPWPVGIIIGVFVIASGIVLVRVLTRRKQPQTPDPVRELILLRAHPATDPVTDRDRLATILRRAQQSRPSQALADLLRTIDQTRYAPPGRLAPVPVSDEIDSALAALGGTR